MFQKLLKWFMAVVFVWMITPAIAAANGNDDTHSIAIKSACDKGLMVMAPSMLKTFKAPSESITIPLFIAMEKGKGRVDRIILRFQGVEETIYLEEALEPSGFDLPDMLTTLHGKDDKAIANLLTKGIYKEVELDVSELELKEGSEGEVSIFVEGSVDGVPSETSIKVDYQALALPARSGWYAGDGHVHTAWSPDVRFISIDSRAKEAKSDGFGFIVITDHEDGINNKWEEYVGQCNSAQTKYGIPTLPGVEIAVKNDEGHTLGYAMDENAASVPHNQSLPPQALIDAINDHNPPNSYAVIAHPNNQFKPFPGYNYLRDFRAMELMTGEYTANPETISQWFGILRRGLSSTLSTGKFVVGLGNSDRHYSILEPEDITCNWIYTTSYSPGDRNAVWDAIRSGRASASGRGDLGCFSINNVPQGGIIRINSGETLQWKLVQKPFQHQYGGRKCTKITVYDMDQNVVKTFENPASEEIYFNTTTSWQDNFYVVKFEFDYESGNGYGEVWTNPIFINITRPRLDLIFAVDTTGSMWDDIDNVKSSATEIVNTIDSKTSDYRIAVIDYRDFPTYPYGGGGDYPYHVVLPFSTDKTAIINAIQSLSIGWGADWEESVNSALIRAIYTEGLGAWRDGVKKSVILMGDAPGHDPEPFTGYTRSSVTAAAEAVDPAVIYAIAVGGYSDTCEYFSSLATQTGGEVFTAPTASEVSEAILEAIEEITEPPENSPPDCSGAAADVSQLWPPNHKMEAIRILNVTDPDGDPVTITVTGITQDEPVSGSGSGDTAPDGSGTGTDTAWVRAERDGEGNGRVYRISFTAGDGKGGESSGSVLVGVPHDQGVNTVCVDDGQLYDSTVP